MTGTGTAVILRSEGPDRFRGNLKCRQFHDRQDLDLGGDSRCCCCNPCNTVKQSARQGGEMTTPEWEYCCNCVPRGIWLRFIPDDPGSTGTGSGDCCPFLGVSSLMVHNRGGGSGPIDPDDPVLYSMYFGGMFGITVSLKVGRIGNIINSINGQTFDYPAAVQIKSCAWDIIVLQGQEEIAHILYTMWDNETGTGWTTGTGTGSGVYTEVRYDPDVSCVNIPELVLVEGVEGPDGCTGKVVIEQFTKSRIPFYENGDVRTFINQQDEKYAYLCGQCDGPLNEISCLLVDDTEYTATGTENDKPCFVSDLKKLYWDGSQWILVELGPSTGTGTGTDAETILATGGDDADCPIGIYTWASSETGTGSANDQCFCVTSCGTGQEYVDPCGCCDSVCTKICVRGERHSTDGIEPEIYATFTWFENREVTGELISRGWAYDNLVTEETEYLYLDDITALAIEVDGVRWDREYQYFAYGDPADPHWTGTIGVTASTIYWNGSNWVIRQGSSNVATGPSDHDSPAGTYTLTAPPNTEYVVTLASDYNNHECWLRTQFEKTAGNELYQRQKIDGETLCGCGIYAFFTDGASEPKSMTVRCGFCSCYDFYCGKCRCVPTHFCVYRWDGSVMTAHFLTWDPSDHQWRDDDYVETETGTGTGMWGTGVRLNLVKNATTGECNIEVEIDNYTPSDRANPVPIVFEYGIEEITKKFEYENDSFIFEYTDVPDADHQLVIIGISGMSDSECQTMSGTCVNATPCAAECGSHPKTVYATITQHLIGAMGEDYGYQTFEVEMTYTEYPLNPASDPIQLPEGMCRYTGYIPRNGDCCAIKVVLTNGMLYFWSPVDFPVGAVGPPYYPSHRTCPYPFPDDLGLAYPAYWIVLDSQTCNPYQGDATVNFYVIQRECCNGGSPPSGLNASVPTVVVITE